MKYLLSLIFIFVFSIVSYSQTTQCEIRLSTYNITINQGSVYNGFDVIAPAGCAWTATSSVDWIQLGSQRTQSLSGVGNATIPVEYYYNPGDTRTSTITVGNQTLTVYQKATCSYSFHEGVANQYFPAAGGSRLFPIPRGTASGNCSGTYTTDVSWISPGAGYSVAPNEGAARSGTITFHYGDEKMLDLYIHQEAASTTTPTPSPSPTPTPTPNPSPTPQNCLFLITPSVQDFPITGGTGTITVTGQTGCAYSSLNESGFITLDSGASGTGTGTVNFTVAPNPGTARTVTIFVAGQNFTVNQAGGKSRKRVRFF